MQSEIITLDSELVDLLATFGKPVSDTAQELIVLELYRQGKISSGKAGELLGMPRFVFVQFASRLGIPFFDMTQDEWQAELEQSKQL